MGAHGGRWVEDPILPEVDPPPAEEIEVGAQLIRVLNVESHNQSSRGHTDVVVLARAPIAGGGERVLAAWQGAWQQGSRTTGKARFGWCRELPDRVVLVERPPRIAGFAWFGWHAQSQLGKAVWQAARLLPKHLRLAALTPATAARETTTVRG